MPVWCPTKRAGLTPYTLHESAPFHMLHFWTWNLQSAFQKRFQHGKLTAKASCGALAMLPGTFHDFSNPPNNSRRQVLFLFPFNRWGLWGRKQLSPSIANCQWATELSYGHLSPSPRSSPPCSVLYHQHRDQAKQRWVDDPGGKRANVKNLNKQNTNQKNTEKF